MLNLKKIFIISIITSISLVSITLAASGNIIRRGNLIIDLDTGKITIANDNAEYTSLLDNDTTTGSVTSITTSTGNQGTGLQSALSGTTTTNSGSHTTSLTNTGTIGLPLQGSELEQAIIRGYNNNLTIYNTINDFRADNAITRQEAAKFLFQASVLLGNNEVQSDVNCNFSDKDQINPGLQNAVQQACEIGLMKGSQGLFRPSNLLSRAEGLTVLSRIAGYKDSPISSLRRSPYYKFVQGLGILKSHQNESTMDYKISRGDLMTLLYRLSQKKSYTSSSTPSTTSNNSSSSVSLGAGITDDPEFTTALLWMNHAGMTKFWKAADYNPMSTLTRGQAAQFLSIYDQKFDTHTTSYNNCTFADNTNNDFINAIQYVCEKGILRGGNKLFRPNEAITKAEFIAAILNMTNEYPTDTGDINRATMIFRKALNNDIVSRADESTFEKPITRYEVALLLSKLYLKDEFTKSLSDSNASYSIISPIENDQTIYTSGQQKVFIDINSIDSREFTNGFITLFGTNYKLNKKQVTQYFPTSYVRYGEIIDIDSEIALGMISMSIGQKGISKSLIEGYIIMNNEAGYYTIQSTEQVPYYIITKIK